MFTEHIWFIYNYIHRRTVSRVFTPDMSCLSYWVVYVHSFNTSISKIGFQLFSMTYLRQWHRWVESLVIMTLEIYTLLWLKTGEGLKLRWNWGETETEVNGEGYKRKGSLLGWFIGLFVPRYKIFVFRLAFSSQPSTKYFSSHYTISIPLSPSPSKLGRQPCWVAFLLVCVSGLAYVRH